MASFWTEAKEQEHALSGAERDERLSVALANYAPRLAAERQSYGHFGPYWWWVKRLLARQPGSRRSWLRGSYADRDMVNLAEPLDADEDYARWLAYAGVEYAETEWLDDGPASFHIVELSGHEVCRYEVFDADASEQLDLFAVEHSRNSTLARLFADAGSFSASVWFRKAEDYAIQDHPNQAASSLRRAITHALDQDDRSRSWLRLGQIYREAAQFHKAMFCFQHAFGGEEDAWVRGLMGETWLEAGNPHEALLCFRDALEAMPNNPEYQSGYARSEELMRRSLPDQGEYRLAR